MIEKAANISDLTNAALAYTPTNPIIRANITISVLIFIDWITLFWKINHAPIAANTIIIEKKKNVIPRVGVVCSETESVSGSVVVKNGFNALTYLYAGTSTKPDDSTAMPIIVVTAKTASPLRNSCY